MTSEERREEWAIKVDIDHPVTDFHDRIPDMAYKVSPSSCDIVQAVLSLYST